MDKVVAVVFAHNEEKHLPRTLRILNWHKFFGRINKIIVVDDGSKDKTKEIATKKGAIVVSHSKNLGKREAFVSGAFKAKELGATIMLNFDADLVHLPRKTINQMINGIKNGKNMVIAQQMERGFDKSKPIRDKLGLIFNITMEKRSNAQRAINMRALEPLFKGNKKWTSYLNRNILGHQRILRYYKNNHPEKVNDFRKNRNKWGLETALDILIPNSDFIKNRVYTNKAFRSAKTVISNKVKYTDDRVILLGDVQFFASQKLSNIANARRRLARIKKNKRKRSRNKIK